MTQPPDERDPLANRTPDEPTAPEDQPTIAWTPGVSSDQPVPSEPPTPEPTPAEPPPSTPPTPWTADPAAGEPPPPPTSPIISASPSGVPPEPGSWQQPPPAGPIVGWEAPAAVGAPGREGFVIAGMGARVVAYLLDSLLVSIVPILLSLFVVDWTELVRQAGEAASAPGAATSASFTMAVTPQLVLVTLIGLAIEYIYFVGFWTSGGRGTPGMRGLKMQVVDVATGETMSLTAATKRFIALGAPLTLLSLVPALQSVGGVAEFALALFLFFTAITNPLRQGLHDKWANTLVIRHASSGDGATLVGCLLLIVVVVGLGILAFVAFFAALAPQMEDILRDVGNSI